MKSLKTEISFSLVLIMGMILLLLGACQKPGSPVQPDPEPGRPATAVPVIEPVVLGEMPHDPMAFTEGFEIDGGVLYEGTGEVGTSQLRALDPDTGAVREAVDMPGPFFGEGVTVVGDRIWQLTYTDGVAVEWDRATLIEAKGPVSHVAVAVS